ncbi:uncharacterized protein At1g66480-like [Cryptomeria japonica]|uniref:uncharacterized protein At1g66480-like n=1 Tax=Cryptomeria japonica TaxID=3369 RepID=UPI0025AD9C67|nr:uncharacterized protein At1g66480-like [Cryptomeria japonica]
MKLDGQLLKVKGPLLVNQILADYPGHVILHSEAVRHMGVRAKPLDGSATLNARHLYFLVQLSKLENQTRRVRSEIPTNPKSRLESMLLTRRSISDISHGNCEPSSDTTISKTSEDNGVLRIKVRFSKVQLLEMMAESQDRSERVERILNSCLNHAKFQQMERGKVKKDWEPKEDNLPWNPSLESVPETC